MPKLCRPICCGGCLQNLIAQQSTGAPRVPYAWIVICNDLWELLTPAERQRCLRGADDGFLYLLLCCDCERLALLALLALERQRRWEAERQLAEVDRRD